MGLALTCGKGSAKTPKILFGGRAPIHTQGDGMGIGAIAGGGKGAIIGAGAGGGGGVGATAVMKGEQIRVPSETKLMFTLNQPVNVTITAGLPPSINRATAPPNNRFSTSPQDENDRPPRVRRQPQ
jgi:hypothetical protein